MPELPEVETIKTALEKHIGNARIEEISIRNPRLRVPVPEDTVDRLKGCQIVGYQRRAKYILISLDNNFTLIWHMGMSGKVLICDKLPNPLGKHDHIIVKTSKGFLVYTDPRRFGLFTYTETNKLSEHPFLAKIGPEPFDKSFSSEYLFKKLRQKKVPIKIALLDQEIVVGIGNIYASEILFGARISPLRLANRITKKECAILIEETHKTLAKAIAAGGSTLKDYEKPDGSLGYFQNLHCVYNKTGQRCPICTCDVKKTGGIQKTVLAGRSTFYCSQKQK